MTVDGMIIDSFAGDVSYVTDDIIEEWVGWTGERHALARVFMAYLESIESVREGAR